MPMNPMTIKRIATVLQAIAEVEGWDGAHDSIVPDEKTGWMHEPTSGLPMPSSKLIAAVRRVEKWER